MTDFFVDFRQAETISDLAKMLSVSENLLQDKILNDIPEKKSLFNVIDAEEVILLPLLAKASEHLIKGNNNTIRAFRKLQIPKKNYNRKHQKREVWEIVDYEYQELYKSLSWKMLAFFEHICQDFPTSSSYGYMRGKNILENAYQHCATKQILHIDIKDFFPSISRDRIQNELQLFGIRKNIANILSKILTIENSLALGLHTSPLISNVICIQLDKELQKLSEKYDCKYTRYADDITISGDHLPTIEEVSQILNDNGFIINNEKCRITKPGWHHFVTGLSVETRIPRIPKKMRRKLRQELYYCNKYGVTDHIEWTETNKEKNYIQRNINRLDGTVKYISYFDKLLNNSDFEDTWNAIKQEQSVSPHYVNQKIEYVNLFIDETEISVNNKNYLAIGIVSVLDSQVTEIIDRLRNLLNNYIKDPFVAINKTALQKNGLHYSDATEDLRLSYSDILKFENIKIYIGYQEIGTHQDYEKTYYSVLHNMLEDRLLNTQDGIRFVFIEKSDKISENEIKQLFGKCCIRFSDKSCILLSLPDFALGYFRQYVLNPKEERKVLFFEKLRGKYKVIKNIDNLNTFTRRRHFKPDNF